VLVPVRELAEHLAKQFNDLVIVQRHDPGDDAP